MRTARRFVRCRAATTSIEYCLIAATVVLAIVTGTRLIGTNLGRYYQAVQSATAQ